MEEKERYVIGKGEDIFIANNDRKVMFTITKKKLQDLLNQQDKELSKLRASYQQVKEENQQLIKALNGEVFINYKLPMGNAQLKQQLAENEVKIANLEVLLSENANDRKAMQEFKIGEDEYDLTDEDARNSLCWEVEELKQQLEEYSELGTPKEIDDTYRSRNILNYNLQDANRIIDDLVKQLHDLPKKIVGEIRNQICEDCFWEECEEQHCEFYFIIEYLNAILKKYGGEDE